MTERVYKDISRISYERNFISKYIHKKPYVIDIQC